MFISVFVGTQFLEKTLEALTLSEKVEADGKKEKCLVLRCQHVKLRKRRCFAKCSILSKSADGFK